MPRWIYPSGSSGISNLASSDNYVSLIQRLLRERGIEDPEEQEAFLDPSFYSPTDPASLPGMDEAVQILLEALENGTRIGVWGDFDVDGQTATTLLVSAFELLGANIVFHIPVRATESHGIKIEYLEKFLQKDIDLLLTCDTGISEHESIAYARQRGLKVVITDHHDLPDDLPDADAIINPNMLPAEHPLVDLPGVGVAYKLVEAVFAKKAMKDKLPEFLDLAALGIVADVAELKNDTRYLLQLGLKKLQATNRPGLQSLFKLAGLDQSRISEEDIGFSIAPRLNALGRLGDANGIVEFLTTEDATFTEVFAHRLEGMNAQRKLLSSQILQGALAQLERNPSLGTPAAIVLGSEHWPPGIIGIVASRLAERFSKPTVLLNISENGLARGSARSIHGVDIGEAIRNCGDLLNGFGGHPMAAGLSMQVENLEKFRNRFSKEIENQIGPLAKEPALKIDLLIGLDDLSLAMAEEIEKLAPFGPGNPPLVFGTRNLSIVSHTLMGRTRDHRRLIVEDEEGVQQSILWWNGAVWDLPEGQFDLAYNARINHFRGAEQLQLVFVDALSRGDNRVHQERTIDVRDFRSEQATFSHLESILEGNEDFIVWGEGQFREPGKILGRDELKQSNTLVIWTVPPGYQILKKVLDQVKPSTLYLFGYDPGMDKMDGFLTRLTGLVKYVISNKGGRVKLSGLAQAVAQTEAVTQLGLIWLESQGMISIGYADQAILQIQKARKTIHSNSSDSIFEEMTYLLNESRLFRKYYLTTPTASFIESLELYG